MEIQETHDLSFSGDQKVIGMYLLLMHPEVGLRYSIIFVSVCVVGGIISV